MADNLFNPRRLGHSYLLKMSGYRDENEIIGKFRSINSSSCNTYVIEEKHDGRRMLFIAVERQLSAPDAIIEEIAAQGVTIERYELLKHDGISKC